MNPLVSMREALADPELLGGAIPEDSWRPWRTLLVAAMGEALTDEERAIFTALTGRDVEPLEQVEELWAIVGRRGGKTRAAGTVAAYIGGLCDHSAYLAPGERGVIPILAASVAQAARAFMHAKGILQHSPVLSELVEGEPTSDTIRLTTLVDIEVRPANFRTVRGVTAVAAIADEIAFWLVDGTTNPDSAILDALRPALATTGGPLIVISSPYAKRGELYNTSVATMARRATPASLLPRGSREPSIRSYRSEWSPGPMSETRLSPPQNTEASSATTWKPTSLANWSKPALTSTLGSVRAPWPFATAHSWTRAAVARTA